MSNKERLQEFRDRLSSELDKCIQFWLDHSHDEEYGGFFTCLTKEGKVFDETKYGWPHGRQVWMYARLYNEMTRFHTEQILSAARQGASFMMRHLRNPDSYKCFFSTTRDGRPKENLTTVFTECFYVMAMAEMARATGEDLYKSEALNVFKAIVYWVRKDDTGLGRPKLSGNEPFNSIVVPMILVCVLDVLGTMDNTLWDTYQELTDWSVNRVLAHIQREGRFILENVAEDGKEMPGCVGRKMNPGHAIEAGWFLLQVAQRTNNKELAGKAIQHFMVNPMTYGWDSKYGGLFYFMDVDGLPMTYTELTWNRKLWWPHNEALIAFLMAYEYTGDEAHLDRFAQIYDYSMKHFSDLEYGEWYGYLDQQGRVVMDCKGEAFKGCFHVPRSLMMSEQILDRLLEK